MALLINTNLASINAQRNLAFNTKRLENSIGKLSSGLRIASASDDAAGLSISEKFRAEIRSLQQAERNASDGISLANTAEGALSEVSSMLVRMRELAVQSLNGTNGTSERQTMDSEFQTLKAEIKRLAEATTFNSIKILAGAAATVLQVGASSTANDTISIAAVNVRLSALGLSNTGISAALDAGAALGDLDSAISTVNGYRGQFGAAANRINTTLATLTSRIQNVIGAESRIRDVDVALETAEFTRAQIQQQAGVAILGQANTLAQAALQLLRF